jgi:glycosyltransferase involved in cell wall biosynthesis
MTRSQVSGIKQPPLHSRRAQVQFHEPYYSVPHIDQPIDAIYELLDKLTFEVFPEDEWLFQQLVFQVILPPLAYDGRFVKGLAFCQGVDVVCHRLPWIQDYFHLLSHSGWCAYPWSDHADGLFTLYPNSQREAWFRERYPHKAEKPLIPMTYYVDIISEKDFFPDPSVSKTIDLLCVSRIAPFKNLPMLAHALTVYRKKYGRALKMTWLTNFPASLAERETMPLFIQEELKQVEAILEAGQVTMEILPYTPTMRPYYQQARLVVLGSLIEGKNRALKEAAACDVPVVCFEAFNQYARGGAPAFVPGGGLMAPFDAEALADTWHQALTHLGDFTPRESFLKTEGRIHFMNRLIDSFPHYAEALPGFDPGRHHCNPWLNDAMTSLFAMDLETAAQQLPFVVKGLDAFEGFLKDTLRLPQ